jgi:hypothetical protein
VAKRTLRASPRAAAKPRAQPSVARRDGAGHLDPAYAAKLRARSRASNVEETDDAFLRAPRSAEALSEELGEEFVETATSGEAESANVRDRADVEELGGPFVVTSAGAEFADGVDPSNPRGATKEPFPRT